MKKSILVLSTLMIYLKLSAVLTTPSLVAPSSGAINQQVNVMLDWSTVSGATYEVRLGTDPGMSVYDTYAVSTTYYNTANLNFGTAYFWQVRSVSTAPDSSAWSVVWSFTTIADLSLVAPSNGSSNQPPYIQLDWSSMNGITSFQYELDVVPTYDSPSFQTGTTGTTSYYYASNLQFGTTYYWRARAMHCCDTCQWSATWSFTTLDIVSLVAPSNGATNQPPYLQLDWTGITGASSYIYEYDTVSSFNSPVYIIASTTNSYAYISDLFFDQDYYWRVRAVDATDTSGYSSVWTFHTGDALALVSPSNGAANQAPNVQLDWTGITGMSNYQYEYDIVSSFDSPEYHTGTTGTNSYYNTANLLFGENYYWRVRGMDANDTTSWSVIWTFTTTDILTLVSPSNGATSQTPDVQLDWTGITGITFYIYEYDTVNTFDSPEYHYGSSGTNSYFTTSGLLFGETYYWRVRAANSSDTTGYSSIWSFSTANILSHTAPANGAGNQAPNVTIDWSPLSGITNYDYEIDTSASFNSTLYACTSISGASSQAALSDLRFGTQYWWRVRARHANDTSLWSVPWSFMTTDQLTNTAPANGAVNQPVNVTIDWSPLSGITNYDYEIDTIPSFSSPLYSYVSISGASSQAALSNLHFGTTYYWHARARHSVDTTQWSPVWSFTTVDLVTHVSPANGAVGVSLNPVIDWSAMSGITNYHYQYDTDPNFSAPDYFSISSASSQATLSNLSYGETYYWQVRVAHAADTGSWTSPWHFTTLYQLTTAPVLSSPADGTNGLALPVTIEWLTYTGAVFYEYQVDDDSNFGSPVNGNTTGINAIISGLTYGQTYNWRVRANNGSGYTPWSTVWTFTTGDIGIPVLISPADAGTGISVTSVALDWSDVSSVTGYEYEYSTDNAFSVNVYGAAVTPSDATITGLDYSTIYYWHVRATDGLGYGQWSATWSFTTEFHPLGTVILNQPSDGSISQPVNGLNFDWFGTAYADEYEFEYSTDNTFITGVVSATVTDTFSTVNGLAYNTQYYWRVRAVENGMNYGQWSSVWTFTTEGNPFGAPILLSPADGAVDQVVTGLLLDWSDVVNAVSYEYQYSMDSTFATYSAGSVAISEATVNGLSYLTKYSWRVRAFDGTVLSAWSDTLSFTTMEDPVGIAEVLSGGILVYPNPASELIHIHIADPGLWGMEFIAELTDIEGRVVYSSHIAGENHTIDVTGLSEGVYLIRFKTEKINETARILILSK